MSTGQDEIQDYETELADEIYAIQDAPLTMMCAPALLDGESGHIADF